MLQFFNFNENAVNNKSYRCLTGRDAFVYLAKRTGTALFLVYATLFVAAANPFSVNHPAILISGGCISLAFLVRAAVLLFRYGFFRGASVALAPDGIRIIVKGAETFLKAESIKYLVYTLFGDIRIVMQDKHSAVFPIHLLKDEDRREFMAIFPDIAPGRTLFLRKAYEFADAIVVAMILAVHIIQFAIQHYYIPTGSMEKTLMIDDHLFGEKITFGPRIPRLLGMKSEIRLSVPFLTRDVRKGDIIIFNPPVGDVDKDYIKRCIAVEGDDFRIKNDTVYINGVKMSEPYTQGVTSWRDFSIPASIEGRVPKGMLIAMGDNREHSLDSRYFGYVPVERVKARAFILTFNTRQLAQFDFSRFGLIR